MKIKRRIAVLLSCAMVMTSTSLAPVSVYGAEDVLIQEDADVLSGASGDEGILNDTSSSLIDDTLASEPLFAEEQNDVPKSDLADVPVNDNTVDLITNDREEDENINPVRVSENEVSRNKVSDNSVSENDAEDSKDPQPGEQDDDPTAVIVTLSGDGVYRDSNGFEYSIDNRDRKATVTKWTGTGKAVIPAKVKIKDYQASLDKGYRVVQFIGANAFREFDEHRLREVQIPGSVTEIQTSAFSGCAELSSVTIPNSVTIIKASAFEGCTTLSSANLSTGLTTLEANIFNKCAALRQIEIPNSLDEKATVATGAFSGAENLKLFTFGPNTKKLANNLFAGCTSMETIDLPSTLTNIGKTSFANCTGLKRVTMPEDVKEIGESAFSGCTSLEVLQTYSKNGNSVPKLSGNVIMMPRFISTIGTKAFASCKAIEKLTIPRTVETIGNESFASCENIEAIEFVEGDSEKGANQNGVIGPSAFSACTSLRVITIPQTIKIVGESAFNGCTSLEEVIFANEFEDATGGGIGSWAFNGCTKLKKITISDNIGEIGAYAFAGCTSLGADGATVIPVVLPDNVKILAPCAFLGCTSLKDMRLSNNLETIGNAAFKGCSSLRNIELPGSIKNVIWNYRFMGNGTYIQNNISSEANRPGDGGIFRDCSNLWIIEFEEGTANLADYLLNDTESIEYINIPKSLKKIGKNTFRDCINLVELRYEDGSELTTIDDEAFYGCRILNNYTDNSGKKHSVIPDKLTTIGNSAFYGCINLEEVKMPSGVQKIGPSAFANCERLEEVYVPNTVAELGTSCFLNCKKLKKAHIPDDLTSIPASLFEGCQTLSDNNLPLTLTDIGTKAFYNCDAIKELDLTKHKALSTIQASAFEECGGLTSVKLSSATNSLGDGVFNNCDELVNVELGTGLSIIPVNALSNLGNLKEITIPRNVEWIKGKAFENDSNLSIVHISKETQLEPKAFSYSAKLTIMGIDPSYAKSYAESEKITFKEEPVPINKISFTETYKKLEKGKKFTILNDIKIEIEPVNYSEDIKYSTSNQNIIVVDDKGVVTGVSKGKAELIASVDPETAVSTNRAKDARITIDVREPVSSVVVEMVGQTSNALYPGDVLRLKAEALPYDAYDTSIKWSSNNPKVADVDNNGVVTAYVDGTARIIASSVNGKYGYLDVVVEKKPTFSQQTNVLSTNKIGKPVASVASGSAIRTGTVIHLKCDVEGADIWYTTNGKDPGADYNGVHYNYTYPYSGGIKIAKTTIIKAFAVKKGFIDSEIATFEYTVDSWGDVSSNDIGSNDPDMIPQNIWFAFDEDAEIYKASDTGWPKETSIIKSCTGIKQDFDNEIRVYDGTTLLVKDRDYKITYKNSINAAGPSDVKPPTFTIKGIGNYKYSCSFLYEIDGEPESTAATGVKIGGLNKKPEYTGEVITLDDLNLKKVGKKDIKGYDEVTLYKGSTKINNYTVNDHDFKKSGTFNVIFTLDDNTYVQKAVTVKPYDFKKDNAKLLSVELDENEVAYNPAGAMTGVTVTFNDEILEEGIDYTLSFKKNKKIGTAKAVVKGMGLFKGKKEVEFKVVGKPVNSDDLKLYIKDVTESSDISKILKTPIVMDNGTSVKSKYLSLGKCKYYDVVSGNEITDKAPKAGTLIKVSCTVTATKTSGNPYTGSDEIAGYYRVIAEGKDIKAASVAYKNNDNKLPFAGGDEIIPISTSDFNVTMPGNVTLKAEEYEIESITNNRFIGTCTVVLRGKGEYGGTRKCKFKIAKKTY